MLCAPGSALTESMLRDLENGGPIEADHIVGFVLEKARVHGVDEGMLAVAYAHLKAYEARRRLGRTYVVPSFATNFGRSRVLDRNPYLETYH